MRNIETIMTLIDEHAKDMLRRFGGTNVDPDKSRAAVYAALQQALDQRPGVVQIVDGALLRARIPLSALSEVPVVTPQKAKMPSIFGGNKP